MPDHFTNNISLTSNLNIIIIFNSLYSLDILYSFEIHEYIKKYLISTEFKEIFENHKGNILNASFSELI